MVQHISSITHNMSANRHPQIPHHAWGPTRENIDFHIALANTNRAFLPGLIGREHTVHNSLHLGPPAIAEDLQAIPNLSMPVLTKALLAPFRDIHCRVDFWCLGCLQHCRTPFCILEGLYVPNEVNTPCRLSLCQE